MSSPGSSVRRFGPCPSTAGRLRGALAAAQPGQPPRTLALDQRHERRADEVSRVLDPGTAPGLGDERVVESEGPIVTSKDDRLNVGRTLARVQSFDHDDRDIRCASAVPTRLLVRCRAVGASISGHI